MEALSLSQLSPAGDNRFTPAGAPLAADAAANTADFGGGNDPIAAQIVDQGSAVSSPRVLVRIVGIPLELSVHHEKFQHRGSKTDDVFGIPAGFLRRRARGPQRKRRSSRKEPWVSILATHESLIKRDELVERGYTSIPGVMSESLVHELRAWSDALFER